MSSKQLPLGHTFEPPPGVAMTDPTYDKCAHRADEIRTVCGAPDGAHDAATAWAYDPNVISWDWKAQPDMDALARLLAPYGVALTTVDTGGDAYAVRVGVAPAPPRPPVQEAACIQAMEDAEAARARVAELEGQLAEQPDVGGWELYAEDGIMVSNEAGTNPRVLVSGPDEPLPVSTLLAFIADTEEASDER